MPKERLLIIEDEPSVAKQLKWSLGKRYEITTAGDPRRARELLSSGAFPVATLDLGLPPTPDTPREGIKLIEELPHLSAHTKVIVITGNAEDDVAVRAIASGAADFCSKPIDIGMLQVVLDRIFKMHGLEAANRRLQQQADESGTLCGMVGVSSIMRELFAAIRKVSANNYPVLITGPSGTGKEMAAHAIHQLSRRSYRPLTIINCGAIPDSLLESELFGHEKGAFTGATERRIGKFEQADCGTVFLDEIGELPLAMQVKLLRCLQEGTIERVGGEETLSLDLRILAATNIDLERAVKEGLFREDLFFRLNVVPIEMPALKERPEDVLVLAHHFLNEEAKKLKRGLVSFAPNALAAISAYYWPGNVRELQNRIRRALSVSTNQIITPADLNLVAAEVSLGENDSQLLTLQQARNQAEQACIRKALLLTGNNISQAAKLLETSRPTLHDLIKKHGIKIQ